MPQECRADLDSVVGNKCTCDSCCGCSTAVASAFLKYALDKWPHFHSFSHMHMHKRQHLTFWKLGCVLDEYETLKNTCPNLSLCLLVSLHPPAKTERGCIMPVS